MLAKLTLKRAPLTRLPARPGHTLFLLPPGDDWHGVPGAQAVQAAIGRKGKLAVGEALAKSPLTLDLPGGHLGTWLRLDPAKPAFDRLSLVRKAVRALLDEHPPRLNIAVYGDAEFRRLAAREAARVAWLNGAPLPVWKKDKPPAPLARIHLYGAPPDLDLDGERAVAEGNLLCRELTWLPPNLLTPAAYRARIRELARAEGWKIQEYDHKRLRKLGAGAFLAVARGSGHQDAAIVRLSYQGQGAGRKGNTVALVGKGICFDTGGHNLKPARYMHNMHDDMNGSAVVLGILLAATRLRLPVRLDAWLAVAQNHLSPEAYTQNEVVTALNGTTIEIMHTDAEGRMVLADALTLAAREKPELILDFATLTGSMAVALGERMSGVIANRDDLAARAVAAGQTVGERVVAFPLPEDYDEALESPVADVKQCLLEGEADHILAARFLHRFVDDRPWLHMDLSASRCKGGLGAVGTDITGFGVALGVEMLRGDSQRRV
ncbi:MAG TPA: leucyl aminopeptidase family protein [Thiobacillaceae bacterium]|nr:leucyl aminopeptidase family protein [Thiobacillaceae bacterium]